MIKQILILNYEYPPLGGGAANATYHLLKQFEDSKQFNITLITSSTDKQKKLSDNDNITIHYLDIGKKGNIHYQSSKELLTYSVKALSLARKLNKTQKFDLVHAFFGIPCGFIAMLLGIPFIVSLRGSDVPFYSRRWYYLDIFIFRYLSKLIWYKAKKVIANSQGLKNLALKTYPNKNISIIPNGVDTNLFYPAKKSNPDLVILFVGRLIERKGVDTLINAFAKVLNVIPCHLIIAGDGNQRTHLESLANRLGLSKSIDFLGVVEHKDLPEIYRKSDIYVLPSKNEGMSNTCLEAIASGLPVIITETGGTAELLKGNGIIIEPDNVISLKEALLDLLKDTNKRKQFGTISRELAKQMSWHNVANAYEKFYKSDFEKI